MSAALNLVLVAEGIEQVEQARWLQRTAPRRARATSGPAPVELPRALALLRAGLPRELDPPEPPERARVRV